MKYKSNLEEFGRSFTGRDFCECREILEDLH